MNKLLASQWLDDAKRLALVRTPHARSNSIAMALADAYRQGYGASRKEEVEEAASATARIKELEDLLAFDKHAWQFHASSYAAMCLSEEQISLGKFCEYMRGLRDGKKDSIVQGIKPLVELEPDYAAILLRTIVAEAERAGSWTVPLDMQERIAAWLKMREVGKR